MEKVDFNSRKSIKEKAQDIIIDCIRSAQAKVYEGTEAYYVEKDQIIYYTEEEKQILMKEISKQATKIAKQYGYDKIYFD